MFAREDVDQVAVLRLSHGKVSALDVELCGALEQELQRIAQSDRRALVLTGTGTTFSAGVDLFRMLEGGPAYAQVFLPTMIRFFDTLLRFAKPVVAAVNGHAIAGGCIIAAAADYRLMARRRGRIGVPELVVGVPFPALPLEIVSARVSPARLRAVLYTGITVEADEALALGFVDEATEVDVLLERALVVARQFTAIPPATFALTKRALIAPILERVAVADDRAAIDAWGSDSVRAAIKSHLDRAIKRT